MELNRYRFRSTWRLAAPPAAVHGALRRVEDYPAWWPQVRDVVATGEDRGTARFRSLLPYDLWVTAHATSADPGSGVLRIAMTGDLEGWAAWSVHGEAGGTRAVFTQEVVVRRRLLRVLALPGRPLFIANHALMMRSGQRGLRAWLRRGLDEG
jgi:hypothetical protein